MLVSGLFIHKVPRDIFAIFGCLQKTYFSIMQIAERQIVVTRMRALIP